MKDLSYEAQLFNAKLLILEDTLVSMTEEEMKDLLGQIGYGASVTNLLTDYRTMIIKFRESKNK